MNSISLLLFGLLCVVLVNGRHFGDRDQNENAEDDQYEPRKHRDRSNELRHRRRRWQMNYGYDYQPHSYYPDRRSYDRNQDVIPEIFKILEDLSDYIKRDQSRQPPPPPPQPIYVPYPVPYPVPTYINCSPQASQNSTPNITAINKSAFDVMEDKNQNWGGNTNDNLDYEDDGNDGARPVSFDPIKPKQFLIRPAPKVEHGSVQAQAPISKGRTEQVSTTLAPNLSQPGPCNAAILSCCGYSDLVRQGECFRNVGCEISYNSKTCSQESIKAALNSFKQAYSPVE